MEGSDSTEKAKLAHLLQNKYCLRESEINFAKAFFEKAGLKGACEVLDVKPSTARTHLYRVMEETGTHSQAELMKLLCEMVWQKT